MAGAAEKSWKREFEDPIPGSKRPAECAGSPRPAVPAESPDGPARFLHVVVQRRFQFLPCFIELRNVSRHMLRDSLKRHVVRYDPWQFSPQSRGDGLRLEHHGHLHGQLVTIAGPAVVVHLCYRAASGGIVQGAMVAVLMCSPVQHDLNRFGLALSLGVVPPATRSNCCSFNSMDWGWSLTCCRMILLDLASVPGLITT
jgi:hypothetical protein